MTRLQGVANRLGMDDPLCMDGINANALCRRDVNYNDLLTSIDDIEASHLYPLLGKGTRVSNKWLETLVVSAMAVFYALYTCNCLLRNRAAFINE